VCVYQCVYVYVCVCVCMYVCMYVCSSSIRLASHCSCAQVLAHVYFLCIHLISYLPILYTNYIYLTHTQCIYTHKTHKMYIKPSLSILIIALWVIFAGANASTGITSAASVAALGEKISDVRYTHTHTISILHTTYTYTY
jgi:hypothetical protein